VLRVILGNTKWVLGFYHFIVDELFGLAAEFKPVFSDSEAFAQKGQFYTFPRALDHEV
jgi:mediator of RNA polymerase II transcription subunit 16, fungi type